MSLSDGANTPVVSTFNVIIGTNLPPAFNTVPVDQTVSAGHPLTYSLPTYYDPAAGTVVLTLVTGPIFAVLSGNAIIISPSYT